MFQSKEYHEKQLRYSIRKVSFGAASVAIASLYLFMGSAAVSASEVQHVNGEHNTVTNKEEAKKNENHTEETLDKISLTRLIEEIEDKFAKGTYANKTEDSVNQLKTALGEAKSVLNNAKTQAELSQAHANLIVATTKLQTKPEEKKEAPAVDTTNGKATVGKKATNTEKASESNSIANSGSRDERNGKEMDRSNSFRTDATPSTSASADPMAINNNGVSIINGDFSDTTLGAELPTATSPIASTIVELSKLKGWNAVDSSTNKVLLIWAAKTGNYDTALPGPRTNIATVLSAYNQIGNGGTRNTEYGPIYQDIDVVPGQEVTVSYRSQSIGQTGGINGAKLIVKDANTGIKIAEDRADYKGQPIGEFSKIVNVPDGVTKLRLQFESISNRSHDEPNSRRTPDGLFAGASVSNVRVGSGAYVVPTVTETTFSKTAVSATEQKVRVRIQAKLENKGETASTSPVYSMTIPEGARLVSYDKSKVVPTATTGNKLSMRINSVKPKSSQEFWYELELPATKAETFVLNPTVTYQTNGNLILGTTVATTKKEGVITSPAQTVTVNMYKGDLQAEVAKAATLNQSVYTPETWAAYQAEIAKAQAILNEETNNVEIANRKNQADINAQTLLLQQVKDGLSEAATAEEKAKLKADADSLVKADTTGKTTDSIKAYESEFEKLKKQLEAAKTEAVTVLAKTENATKEEVKAAQAKVDAVKTELENAKNLLVEAATTEEKTKLKTDSDALKKADTTGKTADSIKVYEAEFEKLKDQLEVAKNEAAAVLAKENNASKAEVQAAQEKVDAAKTALDKAAESLKDIDRDAAKKEIADAAKKATDAIEASTSLTQEQKAEEKAKVAKEAKDATDAIDNATTEEGINSAKENGKLAIEKETAITAINAEKAAKEQEIDNNTKLSDEEKSAAKVEVAKAAIEAVEAIKKADSKDAVDAAKAEGEKAIKAVNPIGKEKALDAIQKAAEEKIAEIDKNDKLSAEEKATAKAEVAKAAIKAVEAIQKAATQEAVNAAQAEGETAIKAVNPVGKKKPWKLFKQQQKLN